MTFLLLGPLPEISPMISGSETRLRNPKMRLQGLLSFPLTPFTADDEVDLAEQAERLGCVAYLKKTDPGQTVLEAVRRAVALSKAKPLS